MNLINKMHVLHGENKKTVILMTHILSHGEQVERDGEVHGGL
jgi:hypothetical protein